MRVLLTAFEPFDGTGLNSSLEACRLALERLGEREELDFAVLPVEYGPDVELVERRLAERPADVLLHTGQATSAATMRVERIAVNVRYEGAPGSPQRVIEERGPAGLFATIDVDAVAAAIRDAGVPAAVSNHAGVYLCNHALYRSLRRADHERSGTRVGFLHIPRLPEQVTDDAPSLPVADAARGVLAALGALGLPCAGM